MVSLYTSCFYNLTENQTSLEEECNTKKPNKCKKFYISRNETDLRLYMWRSTSVRKNPVSQNPCITITKFSQNFVPSPPPPLFVICGHHKQMTSVSYILRKFLRKKP